MNSRFEKAYEDAQDFSFAGYRFDEPCYDMLNVTEDDFLEHLRVQSAGLAYYGALAKQVEREYDSFERRYRQRYNEMYRDCSESLLREGKKNNVRDIESFVQFKYGKELDTLNSRLEELKAQRDYVSAFFDGWKQKSFTLSSMTQMITAGLLSPRESIEQEETNEDRLETARRILSKKRQNSSTETEAI